MDDIWFTRLIGYVKTGLGEAEIAIENLSKITVLVMEFVDSFISTASETMTSEEKHLLAVTWVDKLVFQYCNGKKLSAEVQKLNSEFMSRLCEVSKGKSKLNASSATRAPLTKATSSVSTNIYIEPTPTPTPVVAKKKKSRLGCMSFAENDS
jgi:hypothetical protein